MLVQIMKLILQIVLIVPPMLLIPIQIQQLKQVQLQKIKMMIILQNQNWKGIQCIHKC